MLSSRPIHLPTDGSLVPTKTPGRSLKNRAENAYAGTGGAEMATGKKLNVSAFPKTPFQKSSVHPQTGKQRILLTTGRPLGDKTPFPNRFGSVLFQTPLPGKSKPLKPSGAPDGDNELDSLQRPSTLRKKSKQPRNSIGKAFETPVNTGRPWDVSDEDILLTVAQKPEPTVEEAGDDLDEIEYGPPNTLDLPFQPPIDFDLPDYRQVGKMLRGFAQSAIYDDILVPDYGVVHLDDPVWESLPLPELESDDPFYLARQEAAAVAPAKASAPPLRFNARLTARAPFATPGKPLARPVTTRVTSRVAVSSSQSRKVSVTSLTATRSNSVESMPVATQKSAIPLTAAKPSTNGTTVTRKPAVSRPASRTATTATKSGSSSNPIKRPIEVRRPHTSIAVTTTKAKAKATPASGFVFEDGLLDVESDFLFNV